MPYYEANWISSPEATASPKAPQERVGIAIAIALLLPLFVVFVLGFFWSGNANPKAAIVLITTEEGGSGTGVLIKSDGTIITEQSVVMPNNQPAKEIDVHIINSAGKQQTYRAELRKTSSNKASNPQETPKNYALLKIQGGGFPYMVVGDSRQLTQDAPVTAIGFPSVPRLAPNDVAPALSEHSGAFTSFSAPADAQNLIYHNCKTEPGNQGGALIDTRGRLVGILAGTSPKPEDKGKPIAIPTQSDWQQ